MAGHITKKKMTGRDKINRDSSRGSGKVSDKSIDQYWKEKQDKKKKSKKTPKKKAPKKKPSKKKPSKKAPTMKQLLAMVDDKKLGKGANVSNKGKKSK